MNHARWRAIVVMTASTLVLATACGGHTSRSSPSTAASSTAASPTSADSSSTAVSYSTPPSPSLTTQAAPTVPADVPTTGPNLLHAGETPPAVPALAMMDSAPGAVAFAKFFIQTLDWGYATTSTTYVRHYYDAASCGLCEHVADAIDQAALQKRRFIGDRFLNLTTSQIPVGGTGATIGVAVRFDVTGVEVVDAQGKNVSASAPITGYTEQLYLRFAAGGWVVIDMVASL